MNHKLVHSATAYLLACVVQHLVLISKVQGQDPCSMDLDSSIRLNNSGVFSSTAGAGRVEICVCSGSINDTCYWQTVSTGSTTKPMSWKNSIVVCRELGYFDVQSPILQNTILDVNQASSSVDIYPTTFNCDGTESSLIDCDTGTSTSTLPHTTDAYVNCQTDTTSLKVRLTGTTQKDQGVVEYYADLNWRTICEDFWTDSEANLVCISLGYASGTAASYATSGFRGSSVATTPTVQSVSCSDAPYFFSSCSYVISASCATSINTLAGAVCVPDTAPAEGSVRLYYTANEYQRVEVYYNGRWGTVCDTVWAVEDGRAACRELRSDFMEATVPTTTQTFNSLSSRPIWILGYTCDGSESSLSSCTRPQYPVGYVSNACSHSNDAGLICVNPSPSGGLSGGAIAGIVIGSIVFVGIVIWFLGFQDRMKKKREAEAAAAAAAAAAARTQAAVVVQQTTTTQRRHSNSSQSSSSSSYDSEPVAGISSNPSDPKFTRAPPPAYSEALHSPDVAKPPQYPDEEKKVPYPVSSNYNPAYPSAPPGPDRQYQGYPPPSNNQPSAPEPYNPQPVGQPFPSAPINAPFMPFPPPLGENLLPPPTGDVLAPPPDGNLPYPS